MVLAAAIASAALVASAVPAAAHPHSPTKGTADSSAKLRRAVNVAGIGQHLIALQFIAQIHDDTRSSGTPGFDASARYVADRARAAGYDVTVQDFEFGYFEETAPPVLNRIAPSPVTYTSGIDADFSTMTYSGSGDVTAAIQAVDTTATPTDTSTSGCEAADFTGFVAGRIALMQRGTCSFFIKATNAQAAGAVGAIVMNRGTPDNEGVVNGTLGEPGLSIPVVGVSFPVGQALYSTNASVTARLAVTALSEVRTTQNVIAESKGGDPDNVVMVGAHLDSVTEGPGINDNGSGSATILEVAEQMAKVKTTNKLRFAWWGAEEFNLLGSEFYVESLLDENGEPTPELERIALYLNFDMVASPNFGRFVYDGDGPDEAPPGSGAIEQVFNQYFDSQSLAYLPTPFDGRSDYGPFIAVGIPAGGLFTGAEDIKPAEEVPLFGGTAGVAYDKCYHQACDTLANISWRGLDQMSDAVAHAVWTFAQSTELVDAGVAGAAAARSAAGGTALTQKGHKAST
jgi:Zn-dependent M28 family amino/carboxypeptidase